jgi:uncharacterized caspase-like protein
MFLRSVLIAIAVLLALTLSNRAGAATRIALVIGNGAYPNIGELANPSNDARLMADTSLQLGFEVVEKINVSQKPMKKAIKALGNRLNKAGKDAVGLFYYAGHGVQVNIDSPAVYEAYLSQYPNGVFAALAKVKIDQLTSSVNNSSIVVPVFD